MSVTMGNAIRQIKLEISGSDIDLPEQDVRPLSSLHVLAGADSPTWTDYRQRMPFVIRSTIIYAIEFFSLIKLSKKRQGIKSKMETSFSRMRGQCIQPLTQDA
jgi:hypothetical protein